MTLIVPILAVLAAFQLLVGASILFQTRRSKQIHQKLFVALLAVLIAWTATSTVLAYVDTSATRDNVGFFNVVNSISYFTGVAAVGLIYVFSLFYPVKKKIVNFRKALLLFGAVLVLLAPTKLISGNFIFADKLGYDYGSLSILFVLYGLAVLSFIVTDTISLYRSAADKALKRQAVTLLLGLVLTVVHALLFIIILPIVFNNNPLLYGIGYLAPYYYTGFTTYGLMRQSLFDIRAVVVRSVAYAVALAFLAAISGGAASLISLLLLGDSLPLSHTILFSGLSVGVAVIYRPLIPLFNKWTKRLFYREAYETQALIDELNKILVSTVLLDDILKQSSNLIATTLGTDSCNFVIFDHKRRLVSGVNAYKQLTANEEHLLAECVREYDNNYILIEELGHHYLALKRVLERNNVYLVVPMVDIKHGAEIDGYIFIGEKKSGAPYNAQDLTVMAIIANELVIATQNALRFREIEGFNQTLQAKVDHATRQLRNANDKLRRLNETKDDFISMASHQLRTPLTSVKGYVSMVLDGDAGKITRLQRRLLNQSFVSSQRMVYLISDLLNVSRLKTGKFIIEPVHCNLAKVIEEEVEQLQETAKSRHLTLDYQKPEHFPTLMLDETKLRQVIMNFLDNAVYYTPAGGHIEVHLQDRPQSIEFTVVDDGIGVPRHEQHHLFTKFFRAPNAKRARPDGTGLGLFMAKKVIIAQGGAIIFKSQEGKGSTFGFTFAKAHLLPETFKMPAPENFQK